MAKTTIAIAILSVLDVALIMLVLLMDRQMAKMDKTKNKVRL